jgi:hypothetical protein
VAISGDWNSCDTARVQAETSSTAGRSMAEAPGVQQKGLAGIVLPSTCLQVGPDV